MDIARVLEAFHQLPRAARKDAIRSLANELSLDEWREAAAVFNARTFQRDIIGSLPLELVVHVFAYLDLTALFRLRLVSRQWHHLLRADELLNQKLREWYAESATGVLAGDEAQRLRKVQHIHRLCTGRPYTSLTLSTPVFPIRSGLVGDNFIWTYNKSGISVCNFRTGQHWEVQTPGRESIVRIAASDELVVFATNKMCFVCPLTGGQRKQFRLPSAMYMSLTCRGRTVACGSAPTGTNPRGYAEIYIWDFDSNSGQSFTIRLTEAPLKHYGPKFLARSFSSPVALLLVPESEEVVVFAFGTKPHVESSDDGFNHGSKNGSSNLSICYSRFSFTGKRVRDGESSLPNLDVFGFGGVRPFGTPGRFGLNAFGGLYRNNTHALPMFFEFDENTDKFVDPGVPISHVGPSMPLRGVSQWKGAYYELVSAPEQDSRITVVGLGTSKSPTFRGLDLPLEPLDVLPFERTPTANDRQLARISVNETYVVMQVQTLAQGSQTIIHCFEEGLKLRADALLKDG